MTTSEPARRRVWTPIWWDRDDSEPQVECMGIQHFADIWFAGCPHEPKRAELIEAARALCNEDSPEDYQILEVVARTYFTAWALEDRRHIEQWPLALLVLAGLREAGYDVVRKEVS